MLAFDAPTVIAVSVVFATAGWIYTARRARTIARKQHTINIMVRGNFDHHKRAAHAEISPYLRGQKPFPAVGSEGWDEFIQKLRFILNHYEFIAAGIRRGDMDESLVLDAERGTILNFYEFSENHIFSVRNNRRNQAIYEHIEWLHKRWEKSPPNRAQRVWEAIKGSPCYGERNKVRD